VKHISHFLAKLGLTKTTGTVKEVPLAGLDPQAIYQFGYENGYAWGEVVGRKQAFEDLAAHMRLTGRETEEIQTADVRDVRVKGTH
jgi:hypothetical protein